RKPCERFKFCITPSLLSPKPKTNYEEKHFKIGNFVHFGLLLKYLSLLRERCQPMA
ncbi:MAG: hypothetical protein ACJA01_003897, partial [Saprospiraceae bacterium]